LVLLTLRNLHSTQTPPKTKQFLEICRNSQPLNHPVGRLPKSVIAATLPLPLLSRTARQATLLYLSGESL
jgi:hypothetical protein